ncbi:unnamed protein product, partial [Choristocarpus tenellus]
EDPTPDATRLAFTSTVYGKDPDAAEQTLAQVTAAEALKKKVGHEPVRGAGPSSKTHDRRSLFDSSLSQQSEDGKHADSIKRDVSADTPNATRLAFSSGVYGKDPDTVELTADQAEEIAALQSKVGNIVAPATAAPIHDQRSLFDSGMSQSHDDKTSDSIKRNVASDTPDATRLAFASAVYGKDPQAAQLTLDQAEEVEALKRKVGKQTAVSCAAPIHDERSMFDSGMSQMQDDKTTDSIKREVYTDTPDSTRLAFRATVYGKDPDVTAPLSVEDAAAIEALKSKAEGIIQTSTSRPAPIHDSRSLFDSDLGDDTGHTDSSSVKREIFADTPDKTRLAFRATVYGKDPEADKLSPEGVAEVETLKRKSENTGLGQPDGGGASKVAPIHHTRSMFDSDLGDDTGHRISSSVKRTVVADTPDTTRLSFFGSTYGDASVDEEQAAVAEELKEKSTKPRPPKQGSKVHNTKKAMFESDYSQDD